MNIESIVIMTIPYRKKEAEALKMIVEQSYGINVPVVVCVDDKRNVWHNTKKAMNINTGGKGEYRVIIHDDITFGRQMFQKMSHVLKFTPKGSPVAFYNPENKEYLECDNQSKHIMKTHTNFWPQVMCYPVDLARVWFEEIDTLVSSEYKYDDVRLSWYYKEKKIWVYAVVPSLFQHLGMSRSTFNIPAKVGKYFRQSSSFKPSFDVFGVDWNSEIENAFVGKLEYKLDKKWLLK